MDFGKAINESLAIENQVRLIMNAYFPESNETDEKYNFRCNVCGDSQKNKNKKRGYILKNKWVYYCHNCNVSLPVKKWIKDYYPSNYRMLIQAILTSDKTVVATKKPVVDKKKIQHAERENAKHFVPILKGKDKLFDIAIQFCEDRMIPEDIWKTWFVATGGAYKNRVIIPFFDNKGNIYFYQGRSLYKWMSPKYLARYGNKLNATYNYYNVDEGKPVICLEGAIDSMFVNNSIAVSGLRVGDKSLSGKYFLLDNDGPGKSKSKKLLEKGETVFIWKKYLQENYFEKAPKDINEIITQTQRSTKFTIEELDRYFTNSVYDKVWLV